MLMFHRLAYLWSILLSLYIYLPLKEKFEIVYDRDKEFIKARVDSETQYTVSYYRKQLQTLFLISFSIGWMMLLSGFYLGYAAQGEGFWLYQKLYPQASTNQVWDELNEEGQFVSESGKVYTYYIVIIEKNLTPIFKIFKKFFYFLHTNKA